MTTQTSSAVLDHSSDAAFRAWAVDIHNMLIAAGLVQTADTGQINFVTVVRPGVSTAAGYAIYAFNDALQATAPIIMKVEYGTGTGAAIPQAWLTVGIASNGAGTITATCLTTRITFLRSNAPLSAVTNYSNFVCVVSGYAGLAFKRGAQIGQGYGGFHICRSCDANGDPTGEGVIVYTCPTGGAAFVTQTLWFSPVVIRTASQTTYALIAGKLVGDTSTAFGLNVQAYKHYAAWPRMRCNPFLMAAYISDIPLDTTFTDTPVGTTPHTYRMVGEVFGYADGGSIVSVQGCMIWE